MSQPTTSQAKPKILVQLDIDPQPSVFDGVVAVDAGVDHLFRHASVTPESARDLVHGAIFTRGAADLRATAIFIGGSDANRAEAVLKAVKKSFFGPFRVSVLFDPNGANTTAAAAVLAALEGLGGSAEGAKVAVLGGTGPVGSRVARLLAGLGAEVTVGSRDLTKAQATATDLSERVGRTIGAFAMSDLADSIKDASVVVAAGAAGVVLAPRSVLAGLSHLKVLIDLNAVPPLGIEGVEATDRHANHGGVLCWGALGVGGTKMKIHKAALRALFEKNDQVIDAEEALAIGRAL